MALRRGVAVGVGIETMVEVAAKASDQSEAALKIVVDLMMASVWKVPTMLGLKGV